MKGDNMKDKAEITIEEFMDLMPKVIDSVIDGIPDEAKLAVSFITLKGILAIRDELFNDNEEEYTNASVA